MKYHFSISLFLISLLTFTKCTSNSEKKTEIDKKTRQKDEDIADSVLICYDPKNEDKWIAEFAENLHRKSHFNGNVLIAKDNKIIFQKAFGWADYLHRDSLKINSEFELASIAKTFTGVAVMQLVEAGKLKLTDDVKNFFPNFPYNGITVEMLLSHRSGMMNYVYFIDDIWKTEKRNRRKGLTNQEVMDIIAERKPKPYAKPNTRFHYNNSNFMVLGGIIEKVTGQRYSKYMMDHIFKPAGMQHTHVYSASEYEKIPVNVVGHDRIWKYSVAQNFLDGPVGDKGIYSTVHDLLLYDKYLKNERLLTKKSIDSLYKGRNTPVNGYFNYGYGWRIFDNHDMSKIVYHTGWWHGFHHIYIRDLNKNIVIIFLGNLANGSLLHLDELFKHLKMPIIRKGAYTKPGSAPITDED